MKVTVTFGDTAVVVPCKPGWTVRDLIDQAARRYRRILEQNGESVVDIHRLEYTEGGILDIDDLLAELVEDRDKLVAVFNVQRARTDSPREHMSNGSSSAAPSPEPPQYFSHLQFQDPVGGEIEVNEDILKASLPLLVRSSSDSALAPPSQTINAPALNNVAPELDINHVVRGALDRASENPAKMSQVNFSTLTRAVDFPGDRGPLGIHVVPYCSSLSGRMLGLYIKSIEENSRSKRENIFQEDECIVKINGTPLQDKTFAQSQEVFRQAMSSPLIHVEVVPVGNKPQYEKSLIGQLFSGEDKESPKPKSPMVARAKTDSQPEPKQNSNPVSKQDMKRRNKQANTPEPVVTNQSPVEIQSGHGSLERVSPSPPARAASSSPTPRTQSQSPVMPGLSNLTNKKGGKKIKIDLKKGPEGLGFTVVTRDSSVHGPGPILVKNILPRGAAIKDGHLQPGDRILEVNGVDMTGRSQEELVAMLRSTKQGENVNMVVARQEDIFLPRELKDEKAGSVMLEDGREQLMYEIPLNETGSAGLGVSLKGNRSRETGEDLGIFIKSIIHGGAAYKDGRLSVNDQLIAVNGESLLGRSNHAAMETLRRSMSSEGNARGTIQLVVLRSPKQQAGSTNVAANVNTAYQPQIQTGSNIQELRSHDSLPGTSRPRNVEPVLNGSGHTKMPNNHAYSNHAYRSAQHPVSTTNGSYSHYSNDNDDLEEGFPSPPSPGTVGEMSKDLPPIPLQQSKFQKQPNIVSDVYTESQLTFHQDNVPRNRTSKSMDLVADESNMGSLVRQRNEPSADGSLGPTLGLWKSSSLESLQTAMSEARQSHIQAQVPFHRPRLHMVRGRGCNQSFRIAIDKSYDGPSEDDDDLSEHSSGHETPASSSSRQELDAVDGKKKKTKGLKKEKKAKGKKKPGDPGGDLERKPKKKGFGLLRFGKRKEDKSKDAAKALKSKMEALSEEELDRIPDRYGNDPRYAEIHSGHVTPDPVSLPDVEDDDSDPNYARINNFRKPPSPKSSVADAPSFPPTLGPNQPLGSTEELEGLYAKVNKSRPPPAESDQRFQGLRWENQQARAAPGYDELDAARRRVLEHDPQRMVPRGADSQYVHQSDEVDRQHPTHPRRDPYDYPTDSRPAREPARPGRMPTSGQAGPNPRYPPSFPSAAQQHRAAARQDVPPSPSAGYGGRRHLEGVRGHGEGHQPASPRRYASPERYYYGDDQQQDPRRKNPVIGTV